MESLITKERKEGSTVQYNIGEKPTVTLYTYINHHLGTPNQKETRLVIIGLTKRSKLTASVCKNKRNKVYVTIKAKGSGQRFDLKEGGEGDQQRCLQHNPEKTKLNTVVHT